MYLISDGGVNVNTFDTIEAIMLTKNMKNIDGVKLDVRISRDNVFILSRYEELNKLTYGKGKVNDYNYSFLRKIKFPSHIFKYYIPTLDEILKRYNNKKIVVLEIYSVNELDRLFILLVKYPYKYYFLGKDKITNKLKELDFDKLGTIVSNKDLIISSNNTFYIKDIIST